MKLFKIFSVFIVIVVFSPVFSAYAQSSEKLIEEGITYYKSGNYYAARKAFEKVLIEIDSLMAKHVDSILPVTYGDFKISKTPEKEGSQGVVTRRYASGSAKDREIIVTIAPAFISSNESAGPDDVERKIINIKGRKAFLDFKTEDKAGSLEIEIQNGKIYIYAEGFPDSYAIVDFANHLDLDKIEYFLK